MISSRIMIIDSNTIFYDIDRLYEIYVTHGGEGGGGKGATVNKSFLLAVIAAALSSLHPPPRGGANGPCSILSSRNNAKSSFITIRPDKDNEL